jgi:hypothetical protein
MPAAGRRTPGVRAPAARGQPALDLDSVPRMSDADRWIEALRAAHDDIAKVAVDLDAVGLARFSGAREWDVAQVLGHLGSQAEIGLAALRAALDGTEPPGPDFNPSVWDRWNSLDNPGKRAGFLEWSERQVQTFEGIDPTTREELRVDMGFLPEPVDVATTVSLRVSELTLHGWDVHVVNDPGAVLLPVAVDLLIDRTGALIQFLGHADAYAGSVQLEVITNDPGRHFGLTIADAVALGDVPAEADGGITLPAESWLRLVAGRLTEEHTPNTIVVAAETITLDDLRQVFPGY